ncbi:MFS transporter [Facilibium subflavum]|uniref:MFS transporter n=1 Tax=Facilibium subflavum TaxID=2219058 RepID=UPI000E64CCEC|nr:MFS transporter [Facilibium subflavum]
MVKRNKLYFLVWLVCSLGLFVDGYDLYIISVAEPFVTKSFHLSPFQVGLIQSSAMIGAVLGALIIGRVADLIGRKKLLMLNLLFFVGVAIASAFSWNVTSLCIFRFLIGFGVGADYPICASYLSEMSKGSSRSRNLASAMLVNCAAVPIGVFLAWGVFSLYPGEGAWRVMLAIGAFPALVGIVLRAKLPESFVWQAHKRLSKNTANNIANKNKVRYVDIFSKKYIRGTLTLAICWFFMDISYYGIALFTPRVLEALNISSSANFMTGMHDIILSTLFVSIFVLFGAASSVYLVKRVTSVRLQKIGFIFAFLGLFIMSFTFTPYTNINLIVIFVGFILFNFFINMGPGITTYMLPVEFYPTHIKATGHGFCSASAKFGAFISVLFIPILQNAIGIYWLVFLLSLTALSGYFLSMLIPHSQPDASSGAICEEEYLIKDQRLQTA